MRADGILRVAARDAEGVAEALHEKARADLPAEAPERAAADAAVPAAAEGERAASVRLFGKLTAGEATGDAGEERVVRLLPGDERLADRRHRIEHRALSGAALDEGGRSVVERKERLGAGLRGTAAVDAERRAGKPVHKRGGGVRRRDEAMARREPRRVARLERAGEDRLDLGIGDDARRVEGNAPLRHGGDDVRGEGGVLPRAGIDDELGVVELLRPRRRSAEVLEKPLAEAAVLLRIAHAGALVDGVDEILVVEGEEDPEGVIPRGEGVRGTGGDDLDPVLRDVPGERHLALLADADVLHLDPALFARVPVLDVDREAHAHHAHARVAKREEGVQGELEVPPLVAAPNDLLGAEEAVRRAGGDLEERRHANEPPGRRAAREHEHGLRPPLAALPPEDVGLRELEMRLAAPPPDVEALGRELLQTMHAADGVRDVHRPPFPADSGLREGSCRRARRGDCCNQRCPSKRHFP